MELEIREIRCPSKRRQIVDDYIIDLRSTGLPGNWKRLNPLRRELWCVLLVKVLTLYAVWISLERYGAVFQVRQQPPRDPNVVVDDLCLGETGGGYRTLLRLLSVTGRPWISRTCLLAPAMSRGYSATTCNRTMPSAWLQNRTSLITPVGGPESRCRWTDVSMRKTG